MWLGGILIFALIAIVTLPLGLAFRWCVGKAPLKPLIGAVIGDLAVSLAPMFMLHPSMHPSLTLQTAPCSLIAVHAVSGVAAGWLWYVIEFATKGRTFA